MKKFQITLMAFAFATAVNAATCERIMREGRVTRGNTGVRVVQNCDLAAWLWHPDWASEIDAAAPRYLKFRNEFESDGQPFEIDVSADERYTLLIDGEIVARGPDRGLIENWTYNSYRLQLAKGRHVIEAVVWKIGGFAPLAQLTWRGGFMLSASGEYDAKLTTGKGKWVVGVLKNAKMVGNAVLAWGTGSQTEVHGTWLTREEPEKWTTPAFVRWPMDKVWAGRFGGRTPGWMLFPSQLPAQLENRLSPGAFKAVKSGAFKAGTNCVFTAEDASDGWVAGLNAVLKGGRLVIPPGTSFSAIWDLDDYYTAYPELRIAGGKGAQIRWGWTESMYDGTTGLKGNRNEFLGKYFGLLGDNGATFQVTDRFFPDGRDDALFSSHWWRAGRWCLIEVKTADEPLVINGLAVIDSRYPLVRESSFASDDPTIDGISQICTRSMQMCDHEMLFDCPYYEQQMYPGDTRVQLMSLTSLSRDDRMIRRAIELFDFSQRDDGNVGFNFPTRGTQDGATYTLCWLLMHGDYAMWHDNLPWLKARIPAMRKALAGLALYENEQGLLKDTPGWPFTDWVPNWHHGYSPDGDMGTPPNAFINLFHVLALQSAARAEYACGDAAMADYFAAKAKRIGQVIVDTYWDEQRGLLSDTIDRRSWSEHVQCMALLADILGADKRGRCFRGLITEPDLERCTVYFSFYLFETYFKFGRADLFLKRLDLWRGYVERGLRTCLESPDNFDKGGVKEARSDCHAWGSHPLYFLQSGLAGVRPAAQGFSKVVVAPCPGSLKFIKAKTPHPKGMIETDMVFSEAGVEARIELPEGVDGTFLWRGTSTALKSGVNNISK